MKLIRRVKIYTAVMVLVPVLGGIVTKAMPLTYEQNQSFSNPFITGSVSQSAQSNIWPALNQQLTLSDRYGAYTRVQKQMRWYRKQPAYVKLLSRNAEPYLYYVLDQTRKRDMPPEVALLPMIESDYNPFCYSNRGATGLWQLMPGTASGFGLTINWWYDGRRDVVASTNAALNELQYLHHYFHNNWLLAFAAYNAGQGAVENAIRYNKRHGRPTDYWSLRLPEETKIYVPKLLALAQVIQHAKQYGIQLSPVTNKPYFTSITLHKQMDINHLAVLADNSTQLVRRLNPGFRRTNTIPHHAYNILVPVNKQNLKQSLFQKQLAIGKSLTLHASRKMISEDGIPGPKKLSYTLKPHQTLTQVGRRFHVSADDIWFWNKFTDRTKIHPYMQLTLWVSPHSYRHHTHRV